MCGETRPTIGESYRLSHGFLCLSHRAGHLPVVIGYFGLLVGWLAVCEARPSVWGCGGRARASSYITSGESADKTEIDSGFGAVRRTRRGGAQIDMLLAWLHRSLNALELYFVAPIRVVDHTRWGSDGR